MALVSEVRVLKNEGVISSISEEKNADDVAIFDIRNDVALVDYDGESSQGTISFVALMNLAEVKFVMDEDVMYDATIHVEKFHKSFRVTIVNYGTDEENREIYSI